MKKIKIINISLLIFAVTMAAIGSVYAFSAYAQTTATAIVKESAAISMSPFAMAVAFISAALSVGISCVAAGIAVANVGSAAMGALSEKPELTGRALIFVGLAEGIAIYGLIIAIMILGKIA